MGFRKLKAKKYNGIYEYFRNSDHDKQTVSYYIAYRDIDNKIKKVKCEAKNEDEALELLNNKKTELTKIRKEIRKDSSKLHQKIMNDNLILEDVAKLYFQTKTIKSIDMIESAYYRQVNPILGNTKISQIKTSDVKNLSDKLKNQKSRHGTLYNPRTIKKIITNLRALFNWAKKEKYVGENPVIIKEIIQVEKNKAGRVLSDDELQKLWNLDEFILKPRLLLFLKTCYHTGARPSAVMDIQVKHINFNEGTVHIRAMKLGEAYDARVSRELLDMLEDWIKKHKLVHDNFIFFPMQLYKRATTDKERECIKNTHTRYQGYAEHFRAIFDKHFNQNIGTYDHAYRVTVYTMRRTSATNVYKNLGIVHAKKFLNHTEIDTTMKYLNIDDDLKGVDYGL